MIHEVQNIVGIVSGTLTFCFHFCFCVCKYVYLVCFCFVCRVFCSAQHKCVHLGPQQQFDGSGALHKTGFSVAKTRNQNTLTKTQVDFMSWELFCTLEAWKTVQTFVLSGHETWEEKHHEMARTFVHLNSQELCDHWLHRMVMQTRKQGGWLQRWSCLS